MRRPIEHETADALRALATDKLTPVLWRLHVLENRLPEGGTVELVRDAARKIRHLIADFNQEASVLASYVPIEPVPEEDV